LSSPMDCPLGQGRFALDRVPSLVFFCKGVKFCHRSHPDRGLVDGPGQLFKYGLNHSSSTLSPTFHIAPLSGPLSSFISPFLLFLHNALVALRHHWLPSPAFSTCRQVSRIFTPSSSCWSCSLHPNSQQYWKDWTVKFHIDRFLHWAIIP